MPSKFLLAILIVCSVASAEESCSAKEELKAYCNLQEGIKKFLDTEWDSLTNSVRNSPQLSKETSLMEAFNVMLSPMLVSANGKVEHAEAMSAFCYNYFQAGMDMTKDHIQKDIILSGDAEMIKQYNTAHDRMKKLQGQCISTLTTTFVKGISGSISSFFKGIIPI